MTVEARLRSKSSFNQASLLLLFIVITELADTLVACNTLPTLPDATSSDNISSVASSEISFITTITSTVCRAGDSHGVVSASLAFVLLYGIVMGLYASVICWKTNRCCKCNLFGRVSKTSGAQKPKELKSADIETLGLTDCWFSIVISILAILCVFISLGAYNSYVATTALFVVASLISVFCAIYMFAYALVLNHDILTRQRKAVAAKNEQLSASEITIEDAEIDALEAAITSGQKSEKETK